jgi:YD repeat-containing protein
LDLGLTLSYNSLVWVRSGNYITFDPDDESISPGFRLGFPTLEGPYWNDQALQNFYLLVMPSGARVELRYSGSGSIYESVDSSHIQLSSGTPGGTWLVRTMDGTQFHFSSVSGLWRCDQVKDRNGNYITITYNSVADVATISDTLNRTVTFNYDASWNLISITQTWNGQTHQWATFGWGTAYVGPSYPGLTNYGPHGAYLTVLTQVGLADGSRYSFQYNNSYGMVSRITYFASDGSQLNYTTYVTPASTTDCPRLTERHDSAENWTGINGVPTEVVTQYGHDGDGACRMTLPDGTVYKEYYGSGWQSGLTYKTKAYATITDANNDSDASPT